MSELSVSFFSNSRSFHLYLFILHSVYQAVNFVAYKLDASCVSHNTQFSVSHRRIHKPCHVIQETILCIIGQYWEKYKQRMSDGQKISKNRKQLEPFRLENQRERVVLWNVAAGEEEWELPWRMRLPERHLSPKMPLKAERKWDIFWLPSFQPPASISHWPNLTKAIGQWLLGSIICRVRSLRWKAERGKQGMVPSENRQMAGIDSKEGQSKVI